MISEIKVQLENCRKLQIPKWNIILDPGVGFAKKGY
jgi:dihydropteroate synthase